MMTLQLEGLQGLMKASSLGRSVVVTCRNTIPSLVLILNYKLVQIPVRVVAAAAMSNQHFESANLEIARP